MNCGYQTEQSANIAAKIISKMFNKYYSTFEHKGRWYLTDYYDRH